MYVFMELFSILHMQEAGLWKLTGICFCFGSGCPIANISGDRCCLSTVGELVTAVCEHGFKCSSLIVRGLTLHETSGSAIADIEITPIEVQAFDFITDNFSPSKCMSFYHSSYCTHALSLSLRFDVNKLVVCSDANQCPSFTKEF